ncbi:MAG: DUF1850 domain-containing protein [Hydrogenophaga sp.]|uniref:DUF1850 domain-containing protein n=1 Tax=Hydrogenophaga sp. TaxID=1904254 RepID=UPI001DA7B65C|nr:DUF1850 domain-containing protein [Hydrogenophaga sp.]MBX3611319.1 DUF1850 domain-containing protein [Hydrogenophaga sp.]
MSVLGLCLALAATPSVQAFVPGEHFTLAWMHSIEHVRWEEDYDVIGPPARLVAPAARIKGSAAGMEPPPDAVLRDGWFHYTPTVRSPTVLPLTRSEFTADYELCTPAGCQPMSHWLASDHGVTLMRACEGPTTR